MDGLIRISVLNRELTFSLVAIIIALGLYSYEVIPQNEDPKVTIRVVQIITIWPGASAEDVELYVTKPLEQAVSKQESIKTITSTSIPGQSVLAVTINDYVTLDQVQLGFQQLRNYVGDAIANGDLPGDIIGPQINDRFGETDAVVLGLVSESGNRTFRDLEAMAERIDDRLKSVEGVTDFKMYGNRQEKLYVTGSAEMFSTLGITPQALAASIDSRNKQVAQAKVYLDGKEINVEVTGPFRSTEDVRETIVSADASGRSLRVRDVGGETSMGYEDPPRMLTRINGKKSIVLAFAMARGNHIVRWGEKVSTVLDVIRDELPADVALVPLALQPTNVENAVSAFMSNFLQAIGCVLLIMGVGMGIRNASVVALAVPLIILMTFTAMKMLGIELHQMSINALIIALGLVVDGAVVIVDNITRYVKMGYSKEEAAIQGSSSVKGALFGGTLTTIAAFFPLALLPGGLGEFVGAIPLVVTITLIMSFFVAMFISPPVACLALPSKEKLEEQSKREPHPVKVKISEFAASVYGRLIDLTQAHKALTLGLMLLMFVGSLLLTKAIPSSFFPPAGRATFNVDVWLPEGWSVGATSEKLELLEAELARLKQEQFEGAPLVEDYVIYAGAGGPRYFIGISPQPPRTYYGQLMVNSGSGNGAVEAMDRLRVFCRENLSGARVTFRELMSGPPVSAPIEIRITGTSVDELTRLGNETVKLLYENPGVATAYHSFGEKITKVKVDVDQTKAAVLGLTSEDIAAGLVAGFQGYTVSKMKAPDRQVDVVLRLKEEKRSGVESIQSLLFTSSTTGQRSRLDEFAHLSLEPDYSVIERRNRLRTITISAFLNPGTLASQVTKTAVPKVDALDMPGGYFVEYGGEAESSSDAMADLAPLALVGVAALFLILAFQFTSVRVGLAIYLTLPMAFIGAVLGMFLMRQSLGFMAILGIVSLAGIVVNNAIILIEFIQENLGKGKDVTESIKEAGIVRFPPIMLTTISTIAGMLPLALFGGPVFQPMCWVIIFGLAFSTGLTLVVMPVLFTALGADKETLRLQEQARKATGSPQA
jgi:multidrug efflux pump